MRKTYFLTFLCCLCALTAVAQKTKKHAKLGLAWELPDTWVLAPEKNSNTRFYAYPNSGGVGVMDLRDLQASNDSDAAKATITFMQENKLEPSDLQGTPRKVVQGKLQMQIFEKDELYMKLDNGTEMYKYLKLMLIEANGKRYIAYLAEIYQKPAKHIKALENAVKTLKTK
jgi:hypothetical protein